MTDHWLRTNELDEALSALEAVASWSNLLEKRVDYWKWVIIALHNATQGFMVLALRGSDGLRPLKDKIAEQWLIAYRTNSEYPQEELDSFLNLYKKIKSKEMLFFGHSRKFHPKGTVGKSIRKLNSLRNDFIHFLPRSWSLEVSGLPIICMDCLSIIEFLSWECGNIAWYENKKAASATRHLKQIRQNLISIQTHYQ